MKITKLILKITLAIIVGTIIFMIIVFYIDKYKTKYLDVKNNLSLINDTFLITNVNVIPMNVDTILQNKTVFIKKGIIINIADSINIKNVQIIDARNQFLIPGLIDMHVHVWDKYELGLYLSNGVTAIRNLWGMPLHLELKNEINNDKIIAPLFFTSSPKLTGPKFIGDDNLNITNVSKVEPLIKSFKKRGYDFIKTYYGLNKDIFDSILKQAHKLDIDVVAHPSNEVEYSYHLNEQIKSIEHAEEIIQQPLNYKLDTVKLKEVIGDFKKSNYASFCPTLIGYHNIYEMLNNETIMGIDQIQYMNPLIKKLDSKVQFERWKKSKLNDATIISSIKSQHEFHLKIIKLLHEAKVNIICGTDSGIGITTPGFSIHQELAFYKEAGLTNYEILKTATVNPSKTHLVMQNLGTIEIGKIANLLLLDNNPLHDLATLQNPKYVFIKGRKLNKETLNKLKNKAKNRDNLIVTALRYLNYTIIEKFSI